MPTADMSIGALSRLTGVKVTTIRFYESVGLMPAPPRSEGDRRLYGSEHQRRLAFIKHARDLGFEMDDIRTLLELADRPDMPCGQADTIARSHLAAVEEKVASLKLLRDELLRMIDSCERGRVASCRVIESLADHSTCKTEH